MQTPSTLTSEQNEALDNHETGLCAEIENVYAFMSKEAWLIEDKQCDNEFVAFDILVDAIIHNEGGIELEHALCIARHPSLDISDADTLDTLFENYARTGASFSIRGEAV